MKRSQTKGRPAVARSGGSRRYARTATRSTQVLKRDVSIVAVLLCILMMAHVFEYACVARSGVERSRLRFALRAAQKENSNLLAQMEILQRPQRVDHLARSRGMVQRNDADFIALAPAPPPPVARPRPMLAGFLPEWLNRALDHKR